MQSSVQDDTQKVAATPNQRRNSKAIALIVPIGVLLLLQWPLRASVDTFSNYTSNITQILFGLYTAFAITAASRANTHLAFVKYGKGDKAAAGSQWRVWARLACVMPWALLLLWTSVPQTIQSTLSLESFREGGFTHGYFVLRFSVLLLVGLALANALADVYFTRKRLREAKQ
jgi:hypothetical protein